MSRRLWIGLLMTVMSTPPILAASSAFSIVVGERLCCAPMFLWNWVPVKCRHVLRRQHVDMEIDDHAILLPGAMRGTATCDAAVAPTFPLLIEAAAWIPSCNALFAGR